MRVFSLIIAFFMVASQVAWADEPIPERRVVLSQGVDFFGADLRTIFDVDFEACQQACLLDRRCKAFTFNQRSNSCFPKSAVEEENPYDGAVSGRVTDVPEARIKLSRERAAQLDFLRDSDLSDARRLAQRLWVLHVPRKNDVTDLVLQVRRLSADGKFFEAAAFAGEALVLSDDTYLWALYARITLDTRKNSSTARNLSERALGAAINAYLRAQTAGEQAQTLDILADALEKRHRGRDMIPALMLAQSLLPSTAREAKLEKAIEKYGFRIVEDTVSSDVAQPRICASFSRELKLAGFDYTPYVVRPSQDIPIEVSKWQICIAGLEHGQRYTLTFRKGLPAANGETLHKSVSLSHYVRDRSPTARFAGRAYVLPKSPDAALPIKTVNLAKVDLVLRRVSDRNLLRAFQGNFFARPLSPWREERFASTMAEEVWRGTGDVRMTLNQEETTRLPMGKIIAGLPAGIYALQASVPGADPYDTPASTQWFVLSDLGLATMQGADGVHVFVRALSDAQPKAGVQVELLSKANSVLATAQTDSRGYARFSPALTHGEGSRAPALIVARDGEKDMTFLSLGDPAFDLSDRGVQGREPAGAMDVFLTTERGIYRGGDTVHATALLRDSKAQALSGVPLTAILTRPDGMEYARDVSSQDKAGGRVFSFPVGATAMRGPWQLAVYADTNAPALAQTRLLVEDFQPERLDFDLKLPEGVLRANVAAQLGLDAKYLFGAPAANLAVEGEVKLLARDGLAAYPGFRFGRHNQPFSPMSDALPEGLRTDDQGHLSIPVELPQTDLPARPLEARFTVRVHEGSGRPVERRLTRAVSSGRPMIGIKPLFEDVVNENGDARFEVLALGEDEALMPMQLHWTVNRLQTRYQWYRSGRNWNWEPITTSTAVASGDLSYDGRQAAKISVPVKWGQYEIKVERADGAYLASSMEFYAGWYVSADAASTPDVLKVALDKPAYRPGDTATLRIVPRYAGKALVTIMSNRLIGMKMLDVHEGENLVSLPVTDEWGAGAYVTATVIRPMDVQARHNPARALGLSYAQVDPGKHKLGVSFDVPTEAEPRQRLDVALSVTGIQPGEHAYVTIAAVDLGILNLTGFKSPDAAGHFFGQRRLGMELRDLYGRLIDGMNGALGTVRSGGDDGEGQVGQASPPPTEKLVSFFTGPVDVGADGVAHAGFDLPAFNGTLRLMAVAWSKTGVGNAAADVLVRDPVVVSASLPRFLAPGDHSRLLLEITHAAGPTGRMKLAIAADGVQLDQSALPPEVTLGEKESRRVEVPLVAGDVGTHHVRVTLTTPDGRQLQQTLTLPVVDNDPMVTRTSRFTLAAGDTFTFSSDVFAGLRPGTGSATLAVGPLARLDVPGLLNALDQYPYGCTEQITSKAMPLLYLDDVAVAMGLGSREKTAERIEQAIQEVLDNQSGEGAFGLWQPDSGDMWLDAYVTDFLSRARAKGFAVPDTAFRMALDNLQNQVNYYGDFDHGGEDLAYALMVLAREGAASVGDLRYYADTKGNAFATPLANAQLGAALSYMADRQRSDAMFARAAKLIRADMDRKEKYYWRDDFGSVRRDVAAALALGAEAGSDAFDKPQLVRFLAPGPAGTSRSTQEAAWTLLAAKALVADPSLSGFTIDGKAASGPLVRVLEDQSEAAPLAIRNGSGREQTVTLTTFGVPEKPEPATGNIFQIERLYFTLDGEPVDVSAPEGVPVGTRMIVVLRVSPIRRVEARLMVVDALPAGFEIDNPDLLGSADVMAFDWLDPLQDVRFTQARSDRFLAAVDWQSEDYFELAYIVRAITPGEYHLPAASVEDMYRPEFRAHSDPGTVHIVP